MHVEIRNAKNGLVLAIRDAGEEDEVVYQVMEDDEIEAFAEFLRYLCDHYGPTTSRYSPKRIHVVVKPGDRYEEEPSA